MVGGGGGCRYYQQNHPSLRPIQSSSAKMTAKEDPELISSYKHTESVPTYGASIAEDQTAD